KYPVTTTVARVPSFTRFATHVSMPEVPVPEISSENDPSAAPNVRPSCARISSISFSISGSRWLMVGVAIARITRGEVRLGPGPSRMRSLSGSRLIVDGQLRVEVCELRHRVAHGRVRRVGCGHERRTRNADVVPDDGQRRLQAGDA